MIFFVGRKKELVYTFAAGDVHQFCVVKGEDPSILLAFSFSPLLLNCFAAMLKHGAVGDVLLLEDFCPTEEFFNTLVAEFFKTLGGLFHSAFALGMTFAVEFVGVANDLFFDGFRQKVLLG